MILRRAIEADRPALESFDVGDTSAPWLVEVAEIVAGLLDWRDDPDATDEGREIIVTEDDGEVVAVAAHSAFVADNGRVWPTHRYLTVVAVRVDKQRSGVAKRLVESLFAGMAEQGAVAVEWLVHPSNVASTWFSRTVFPQADELSRPEEKPYVLFVLEL